MTSFTESNSTYTKHSIKVLGNTYSVLVVKGKFNYISVTKETNNPFKTVGKDFKTFDDAVMHYKNPTMKIELTKIELGFNNQ